MSRSGYSENYDIDNWALIRWRGAVASGLRGKRGQAFLREALAAFDAMPVKALIPNNLQADGAFCTLGVVGHARGLPLAEVDPDDHETVAGVFGIPHAMACEIMWENDEGNAYNETPARRWQRMRGWIARQIKTDPSPTTVNNKGET